VNEGADTFRFIEPNMAIDHVRRVARETAEESGYDAAATALLALYREYRVMPLRRKETPPERLATWEAVRGRPGRWCRWRWVAAPTGRCSTSG